MEEITHQLILVDTQSRTQGQVATTLAMFIPELIGVTYKIIEEVERDGQAPCFPGSLKDCQNLELEFKERQIPCKIVQI